MRKCLVWGGDDIIRWRQSLNLQRGKREKLPKKKATMDLGADKWLLSEYAACQQVGGAGRVKKKGLLLVVNDLQTMLGKAYTGSIYAYCPATPSATPNPVATCMAAKFFTANWSCSIKPGLAFQSQASVDGKRVHSVFFLRAMMHWATCMVAVAEG